MTKKGTLAGSLKGGQCLENAVDKGSRRVVAPTRRRDVTQRTAGNGRLSVPAKHAPPEALLPRSSPSTFWFQRQKLNEHKGKPVQQERGYLTRCFRAQSAERGAAAARARASRSAPPSFTVGHPTSSNSQRMSQRFSPRCRNQLPRVCEGRCAFGGAPVRGRGGRHRRRFCLKRRLPFSCSHGR